jgi:hypothetical protein
MISLFLAVGASVTYSKGFLSICFPLLLFSMSAFGKPAAPFCLPMVIDSGAVIDQPKNFNSWFMLNLLHLWMCYFRLRYEEAHLSIF